MKRALPMLLVLLAFSAPRVTAQDVPDRPGKIVYPALDWSPPDPAAHRKTFDGFASPVVYVVEDPSLPLATFTVHFLSGTADGPVAEMGADLLLRGGAGKESGEEIRRRVDRMGGRIDVSFGPESGTATIGVLSRDLADAVDILADVVLTPAYREEEMARYLDERRDAYRRRNDEIGAVTRRVFTRLVLGPDHPLARETTPAELEKISREDLLAWSRNTFTRSRLVLSLAGRLPDRDAILDRIRDRFGVKVVPDTIRAASILPPPPEKTVVHLLDRPGATQGNVMIGRSAVPEDHPDWIPLTVMNYIFGGSGFPSRITKRVRSDEGLAYHVGTRIDTEPHLGGTFRVSFQTRSEMVPYAISIVMQELARMRKDGVTDTELSRAKAALVDRLPAWFDTPEDTAGAFAGLDVSGRSLKWYAKYRERVMAVTREDVLRVAQAWLPDPAHAVVLVVGDRDAILAGDRTGAHPEKLADFGSVVATPAD